MFKAINMKKLLLSCFGMGLFSLLQAQTWVIGNCELTTLNTVNNKEAVAPKTGVAEFSKKNSAYTFPKYSYTVLTLKR